jgi:hypothetical protein
VRGWLGLPETVPDCATPSNAVMIYWSSSRLRAQAPISGPFSMTLARQIAHRA